MNKSSNEKISEVLGIDPIPEPIEKLTGTKTEVATVQGTATQVVVTDPTKSVEDQIIDQDFAEARDNIKDIIEKSSEAISDLQIVARETESPRAYEVLATLLKQAQDANKDLLDLSKKRKEMTRAELKKQEAPASVPVAGAPVTNIQQAVFVGSTADLGALIQKARDDAASGKPPLVDVTPVEGEKGDDVSE